MGSAISTTDLPEIITVDECKEIIGEAFDQTLWEQHSVGSEDETLEDYVPRQVFIDAMAKATVEALPPQQALLRIMNPRMKIELNWENTTEIVSWKNVEVDDGNNIQALNLSSPDTYHGLSIQLYELGNAILGEHLQKLDLSKNGRLTGNLMAFKNCPHMSDINLSGTQIEGDIRVLRYLPNLEFFSANGCRVAGDIAVFQNCSILQIVSMHGCSGIFGDIIAFTYSPSLKKLHLSACPRVCGDIGCFRACAPDPDKFIEAKADIEKAAAVLDDREYYLTKAVERLKRKQTKDRIDDHAQARVEAVQARRDYKVAESKHFILIGLKDLRLAGTEVDGDIAVFQYYPALVDLELYETRVYGDIEVCEFLPELKVLYLYGRVLSNTDKKPPQTKSRPEFPEQHKSLKGDIMVFRSTNKLEKLNLTGCAGIDGSIIAFEKCFDMKTMLLKGTDVSGLKHQMETIRRTIPSCEIQVEEWVGKTNEKGNMKIKPSS